MAGRANYYRVPCTGYSTKREKRQFENCQTDSGNKESKFRRTAAKLPRVGKAKKHTESYVKNTDCSPVVVPYKHADVPTSKNAPCDVQETSMTRQNKRYM